MQLQLGLLDHERSVDVEVESHGMKVEVERRRDAKVLEEAQGRRPYGLQLRDKQLTRARTLLHSYLLKKCCFPGDLQAGDPGWDELDHT